MIVARRTSWFAAYRWLAIATGVGFFLRILTSLAIIRGSYQSGTVYDLAWIVPFLCYAGGGARRSGFAGGIRCGRGARPRLHVARFGVPGVPDSARRVRNALPSAARCGRRLVSRVADERDDGRRARTVDAPPGGAGRRVGAGRRAHAAACRRDRADRRSHSHHARDGVVRARQRCVRSGARLFARRAVAARRLLDLLERGFDAWIGRSGPTSATAASGAARWFANGATGRRFRRPARSSGSAIRPDRSPTTSTSSAIPPTN